MAYLSMPNAETYKRAVRSSLARWYTVDATVGGVAVDGATGLQPSGGSIIDTTRPGVRRTLSPLELPPIPGLYDLLVPYGTRLTATAHVRLTSQTVVDIPMGVFPVSSEKLSAGGGGLSVTADDKWSLVQAADFLQPFSSTPGISVSSQIAVLLQKVFGAGEVINRIDTSTAVMGSQTWDSNLAQAILDLAKGAGLWVYFDRSGVATIDDAPSLGTSADWLLDAPTELDRERSRERTRNVVVVSSSQADAEAFPTQILWDNDVNSPTYAGTDPLLSPGTAGPFGISVLRYDTPLPLTAGEAVNTGRSILYQVVGLASQVSLGTAPNPAIDAGDVLDVLPPKERYDIPRLLERHMADTVTHPVGVDDTGQHIEGRSTRTDAFS
jgi:hypothetical protein